MGSCNSEITHDVPPYIRVYKDGTVERLVGTEVAPATFDPQTGVSSKDIIVIPETGVTARVYRPNNLVKNSQKIPLLIYFHGGAFCIASTSDPKYHNSLNLLVSEAKIIAVSVNYRLVPEHPLPAAYEDSWAVLKWVASHNSGQGSEDWLTQSVDFSKVFLAGDSSGANISHHMAIRADHGLLGIKLRGIVMIHPYFWGEDPIGIEVKDSVRKALVDKWWQFVCPSDKGCDDPLINPFLDLESFARLACDRIIIFVAQNDILVERGRRYYELLIESKWPGKAEIVETFGEDHVFHIFYPDSEKALDLIKRSSSFINQV
ncbi:hypothetical protein ACH5RR_035019 [Cinchona calisaya]|uniref:Alpha/beta hydrolase fold-3 domain-containing protein n=1 Tax=Cinchona calisaya TaxID=153742 RepID=A0ABD2YDR8_9GENT